MTPETFAKIMDRAYVHMRPWSATEIAETLARPHIHFLTQGQGGLIAQMVADECEILIIATDPDAQRQGLASSLLAELIRLAATRDISRVFLEVAASNRAARTFYAAKGFAPIGTRPGYYTLRDGTKDDGVLLSLSVAQGHTGDAPASQGCTTKSG
ncbi:GNAT family N-acetyltransferase [Marivita sp.]|uniref:GNAT family N-acetyltransferase n=1 Tax=Marivita sp. TaxID=2003365 RepID=UPI0025BE7028|nr:GNAT family N-acetyltransferase [Marivita sp.]